ncbi:MAG: hypothetical protein R6V72_15515 [Cyclobacterium sp.]|uniref:hypothetical protein n=1 Tax=unclassified Cyclobacterium TaxID=2615055 RepID=UPI0013D34E5C|nr:hypothetical protein [Cyclobacterium sp. SYSU L10401]
MKNVVKTSKWLRWTAAGAFGLMLTLNVMVGLDFEKGNVLPSITLSSLSNTANAQSETGHNWNEDNGINCCYGSGNCMVSDPKIC